MSAGRPGMVLRDARKLFAGVFVAVLLSVSWPEPEPVFATTVFDASPGGWLSVHPLFQVEFVLASFGLNFVLLQLCGIKGLARKLYLSIFLTWSGYVGFVIAFLWLLAYASILGSTWLVATFGKEAAAWLVYGASLHISLFIGMLTFCQFIRADGGMRMKASKRLLLSLGSSAITAAASAGLVMFNPKYWHERCFELLDSKMLVEVFFFVITIVMAIGLWAYCRQSGAVKRSSEGASETVA